MSGALKRDSCELRLEFICFTASTMWTECSVLCGLFHAMSLALCLTLLHMHSGSALCEDFLSKDVCSMQKHVRIWS